MIALVSLLLICSVSASQSIGLDRTAIDDRELQKTILKAQDGYSLLLSLIGSFDVEPVPQLKDLDVLLTKVATALPSIGSLFSLWDRVASSEMSADAKLVFNAIQKLNVGFAEKHTSLITETDDPTDSIYKSYSTLEDKVNRMSMEYNSLVGHVYIYQDYSSFNATTCQQSSINPGDLLKELYNFLIRNGTDEEPDPFYIFFWSTNRNYGVLKRLFQVIVKDFARAALVQQACLGITNRGRYHQNRAAREVQRMLKTLSNKFQGVIDNIVRRARASHYIKDDVSGKLQEWFDRDNANITFEMKRFLQQKYFWLLFNVYMPGAEIDMEFRIKPNSPNAMNREHRGRHIVVTWGNAERYRYKKHLLYNVKYKLQTRFASKSCEEINRNAANSTIFITEISSEMSHVDQYMVSFMTAPIYSNTDDNTIRFRICRWFVAISVI